MKLRYATPEMEREAETHDFGELVASNLREIYGQRGEDLEALVAAESTGANRKYTLTLEGLHPKLQVQTSFLQSELQNTMIVKYRVSKAYAELLRAFARLPF